MVVVVGVGIGADIGSDMSGGCTVAGMEPVGGPAKPDSLVGSENMALAVVDSIEKVDVGFGMTALVTTQSARLVSAHCCCRHVDMVVVDIASGVEYWCFAEGVDM